MPTDFLNTTGNRSLDFELDAIKRKVSKLTPAVKAAVGATVTVYQQDSFSEPISSSQIEDTSFVKHFLMGGPF